MMINTNAPFVSLESVTYTRRVQHPILRKRPMVT